MFTSVEERLEQARSLRARGEASEAACAFEAILREHPGFADVQNELGLVWHELGDYEKAAACFRAALEINPRYTEAALHLAVVSNDLGRYREGQAVFERALEGAGGKALDPIVSAKVSNLYAAIGDAFQSAGETARAVRAYREALELHPGYLDIRQKLAQALIDGGLAIDAVQELQTVLRTAPGLVSAEVTLGVALLSAGRREDAIACWRRILLTHPDEKRALMYLRLVGERHESR